MTLYRNEIKNIQEEFIKEFPNPNDRASLDGSVYVHWLESKLVNVRKALLH